MRGCLCTQAPRLGGAGDKQFSLARPLFVHFPPPNARLQLWVGEPCSLIPVMSWRDSERLARTDAYLSGINDTSNDTSSNPPSTSSSYYSREILVVGLNRNQEVGRMIGSRIFGDFRFQILAAETLMAEGITCKFLSWRQWILPQQRRSERSYANSSAVAFPRNSKNPMTLPGRSTHCNLCVKLERNDLAKRARNEARFNSASRFESMSHRRFFQLIFILAGMKSCYHDLSLEIAKEKDLGQKYVFLGGICSKLMFSSGPVSS